MSVKKSLIIAAAGLACVSATAALAGGPEAAPAFQPNVYFEANFGYASADWTSWTDQQLGPWASNHVSYTLTNLGGAPGSNKDGGFTMGVDAGYQFTQNLSVEAAWYYLPKVSGNTNGNGNVTVHNWMAYGAGKLSLPVMDSLDIFGKVGVGYRSLNYSGVNGNVATAYRGTAGYWAPVFGIGAKYLFTQNWSINAQWMFMPGYTGSAVNNNSVAKQAPVLNLFTAGIGYQFAV